MKVSQKRLESLDFSQGLELEDYDKEQIGILFMNPNTGVLVLSLR